MKYKKEISKNLYAAFKKPIENALSENSPETEIKKWYNENYFPFIKEVMPYINILEIAKKLKEEPQKHINLVGILMLNDFSNANSLLEKII